MNIIRATALIIDLYQAMAMDSISLTQYVRPTVLAGLLSLMLIVYYVVSKGMRERGMPPGPPTLPIIGNLHQIPSRGLWAW